MENPLDIALRAARDELAAQGKDADPASALALVTSSALDPASKLSRNDRAALLREVLHRGLLDDQPVEVARVMAEARRLGVFRAKRAPSDRLDLATDLETGDKKLNGALARSVANVVDVVEQAAREMLDAGHHLGIDRDSFDRFQKLLQQSSHADKFNEKISRLYGAVLATGRARAMQKRGQHTNGRASR